MASVNSMGVNQVYATLNALQEQASGAGTIQPVTNTTDFITVGTTLLQNGTDAIMNAISQVLTRTIFSVRPYTRRFRGLYVDNETWGGHVRKINYLDTPAVSDNGYELNDGQSVDMYVVRKPDVIQTNFYGRNTYQDYVTRWSDQIKAAFRSEEEFGSFWAGLLTEISNKHEQFHDDMARVAVCNFIAGKINMNNGVVHLLTEYNDATGLNLTASTVMQPTNYKAFVQWMYARIASISKALTERSALYHVNLTGRSPILRHTPYSDQKIYLYAPLRFEAEMMAIADVYHDNYLRMADVETVNFWQSIQTPDQIAMLPAIFDAADGSVTQGSSVLQRNVVGVILDREAVGIRTFNEETSTTPYNSRGRYYNIWWNFQDQYWNDFTENGVVLLMD